MKVSYLPLGASSICDWTTHEILSNWQTYKPLLGRAAKAGPYAKVAKLFGM